MSETIKTNGIILKIKDTPGKDKLVIILTQAGVISAFMAVKRNAGKKNYIVDIFTYAEFVLFKTDRGNFLVNSATPIECFYSLRNDVAKIACAGYFSSLIINSASSPDADHSYILSLLYDSLRSLSEADDVRFTKSVFELKMSVIIGVEPCLVADKKAHEYYFDMEDGHLHLNQVRNSVKVKRDTIVLVYKILKESHTETFLHSVTDADELYYVTECYIMYHTEGSVGALEFLKGVI